MENRKPTYFFLLPAIIFMLIGFYPVHAAPENNLLQYPGSGQTLSTVTAENQAAAGGPEAEQDEPPEPSSELPGGTICVNAFHDENGNGLLDDNEGHMAGITMIVASDSDVVGQAISDGSDIPTCFQSLAPGPYQVAQQIPGRLEMTTAGNALVVAEDNHTVHIAFGSRLRQDDPSEVDGSGVSSNVDAAVGEIMENQAPEQGLGSTTLIGLGIVLLGALLLGLLLFFLLRR